MMFFRALLASAALAVLASCSLKPTQISFLDRVVTVEEFTAKPELRARVLAECTSNPGQLNGDANCVNAKQSLRLSATGTGNFPSLDITPPKSKGNSK